MYSNERLIPIFKIEVLIKILDNFEISSDYETPVSTFQKTIIANKPAHLTIYEYAEILFENPGKADYREGKKVKKKNKKLIRRKASAGKNTQTQQRRGSGSYIAIRRHNILQETLQKKLISVYGAENVLLEEDFVDIKLL